MIRPRKGIILAGGTGSRLDPMTRALSKQCLPVYDKPMIYYPLSTLMLLGIRDILVISTPQHIPFFINLLGDGTAWGIHLQYQIQPFPGGIAQAFVLGKNFVCGDSVAMILGDNLFYGYDGVSQFEPFVCPSERATIFAYPVHDVSVYGAVRLDKQQQVISLIEKPAQPSPGYAITGLYIYDDQVCDIALDVQPSQGGEREITAINQRYLERGQLQVKVLDTAQMVWFDLGHCDNLLHASFFIASLQKKKGAIIACPEAIAYQNKWIDKERLLQSIRLPAKNHYARYLKSIIE